MRRASGRPKEKRGAHAPPFTAQSLCLRRLLDRLDRDELAHLPAVGELDHAADLGKQGVILAATYVQPGLDAGAALPHDDGSAGDRLAAERLHSQPLRIRVATVLGTA